ncbi:putative aminoacyltransferase, E1 ubiquitin-activating enzyme [Rosa chinensis]|uniref:E3 ubiquitin protein ligase n=1 Tax=Rosa chinensis TaxID=74649 RepID=A0A2P6SEZ3_ROSCH|nr:E3 ubiquitin-protein ligase BRE1-like 1 isoform X1 [Rosa chinensis]PRQ57258.1 putative aminoacyltransferase, E1 ubiquitin-activating enzyme [Rosa chinensis]
MGSTGEHDRKRRHFSSISSPTAAAAKKQPFLPISEDKKLDIAVLQYQNQKLSQKLETQKVEYSALQNELSQLEKKQLPYDPTLSVVNKSWKELVKDLESCSIRSRKSTCQQDIKDNSVVRDGAPSTLHDAFLSRLAQAGATESSCTYNNCNKMEEDRGTTSEDTQNILGNIVAAIDNVWNLKDALHDALLKELPEDGLSRQRASNDSKMEVKNLRLAFSGILLKHRGLARELQNRWDIEAKNKAEIKRLKGELETTLGELEENNRQLASLKAERDSTKGATFPVLNFLNKPVDRARDKQKDLQDMESTLKELTDQASCRLMEIKSLHEERIKILQQLSSLQNMMRNAKCLSSSKAYLLVKDQIEKSKSEVFECQTIFEKLQVEKDNLVWRERELNVKNDVVDVLRRSAAVVDSRITDLGMEIQKQIDERKRIEAKLEEASREPGRKEVLEEFKALVSSFPEQMGAMQGQLRKYKEAASDFHSLQADVQSLSSILDRKVKECETFSARSSDQLAEIRQLKAVVQDIKETESELKLFLEMYRHELSDPRDVMEARDLECKAWAHVESLKSSLDEHNLELRVKIANEAEATSQQRLAAVEAEIADLRQRLEASKRNKSRLADVLKSKTEENEAYLAEIETIGQAYDDMQTQNQHLLQQITERDDYNIKLVLEGMRARQTQNAVLMDKRKMEREIQQGNASLNFYEMKATRIEDQLKLCSDQIQRLAEHKFQGAVQLENTQKRLMDVRRSSQQAQDSLEESQSKVVKGRLTLSEMQIDLEKERLNKKRIEEELEVLKRKAGRLQAQTEGSSIVEKLQQELGEYREILKCDICLDRTKQVVITKCYHLFCNPCVQKVVESRQRKCPKCSISFGPNDIKSVYI